MNRTPRASGAPLYAAIGIAVLALFVAATTTAFAAGLAANSVGTKQLKKNAVSAKKIKNNAVTGAKIKNGAVSNAKIQNGAVSSAKLAPGVVPPRTVTHSSNRTKSGSAVTALTAGGLTFKVTCNAAVQDFFAINVTRTGGGNLAYSGTRSIDASTGDSTVPVLADNTDELDITGVIINEGDSWLTTFDGVVTPVGGAPVLVQATGRVKDNDPAPCQFRLAATPTS